MYLGNVCLQVIIISFLQVSSTKKVNFTKHIDSNPVHPWRSKSTPTKTNVCLSNEVTPVDSASKCAVARTNLAKSPRQLKMNGRQMTTMDRTQQQQAIRGILRSNGSRESSLTRQDSRQTQQNGFISQIRAQPVDIHDMRPASLPSQQNGLWNGRIHSVENIHNQYSPPQWRSERKNVRFADEPLDKRASIASTRSVSYNTLLQNDYQRVPTNNGFIRNPRPSVWDTVKTDGPVLSAMYSKPSMLNKIQC